MNESPQPVSSPQPLAPARGARLGAAHTAAGLLAAVALGFCAWYFYMYGAWLGALNNLFLPWQSMGGGFDLYGLVWGVIFVALCAVVGWYYLEGLELYIPRTAAASLAFIFGLGLTGFALECLAIPYWLSRRWIALAVLGLLAILAVRAWRRHRARPEADPASSGDDPKEHFLRRSLARKAFRESLERPRSPLTILFAVAAFGLLGAITTADFWHALLYPEVYWDSLILYLGYARMTFLEHGFPVKVTGQVGIGLGANYPHLYAVLGAGASTLAGQWSEMPQRLIAPLAGLATTVLVYQSSLRLTRHVNFSLAVALLWRAVPLGIAYDQYASDYALSILFGAAFLYLALMYVETALRGYFAAATLLIALAMHLNYLMGILWLPWVLTLVATHFNWREPELYPAAPWTRRDWRASTLATVLSWWIWPPIAVAAVIGATWLARNFILTGNPVYAFFYKSLGGININPEVMEAAAKEWCANGAGIGRMSELFPGAPPLVARVKGAWYFFVLYKLAYRFMPLMMAFAVPGALAWCGMTLGLMRARRTSLSHTHLVLMRFGWIAMAYTGSLMAFHFTLAAFYLYQIVMILPGLALVAALAWPLWRMRPWRWGWGALALWTGLFPGLVMALMGFKVVGPIPLGPGRAEPWESLFVLRHPMPGAQRLYSWRYGADAKMWEYVNANLKGERLLTHENRHLVFDPSITLVQLDDWPIQALWTLEDPVERVRQLQMNHGIIHYLFVPNELACPTNARLGAADWPELGLAELEFEAGETRLYRLTPRQ